MDTNGKLVQIRESGIIRKQSSLSHRQYEFNVHIRLKRNRPLFSSSTKVIHELEWMTGQGPPIVLLEIKGLEAIREVSFYLFLTCHPHIVRTFGSVKFNTESMCLLQEYAPVGDLSELLREHRFRPSEDVLVEMFIQICDAMICLADNGIVHGDLACRNVLVFRSNAMEPKENLVKLTDFGSARGTTIYSIDKNIASSSRIEVPIRYAAPEILRTMDAENYSEKSDIYSMGALMWEAFSFGSIPYSSIESDEEVRHRKLNREKLPQVNCSRQLWDIMNECWHRRTEHRPDFRSLKQSLLMVQLRSNRKQEPIDNQNSVRIIENSTRTTTMAPNSTDQNRIKSCSFCKENYTTEELNAHLMICGNKTERCPNCNRYVRRAIFIYHQDNNCTNPEESSEQSRRPNPEAFRSEYRPQPTTADDNAFASRRALAQFASMRIKPRSSQQTVECEYCHGSYERTEYDNHQKNCYVRSARFAQLSDQRSAPTESPAPIGVDRSNSFVQRRAKPASKDPNPRRTLWYIPESTDPFK